MLTMSDSTGFATGGTSNLITVGSPTGTSTCNTTPPSIPYTFSLSPNTPQQCAYVHAMYVTRSVAEFGLDRVFSPNTKARCSL